MACKPGKKHSPRYYDRPPLRCRYCGKSIKASWIEVMKKKKK